METQDSNFQITIEKPKEWIHGYKDGYQGIQKNSIGSLEYQKGYTKGLLHKYAPGKNLLFQTLQKDH